MQIYASTVKLLGDQELEELGLCMGDRATIREMCGEAMRSKLLCNAYLLRKCDTVMSAVS